jgi:tetrapyrrole methylase family protein / MazG family protein
MNPVSLPTTQGITLLGLGPGDPDLLTRQAWHLLESCTEIYLRTRQHPVVASLPEHLQIHSFDDLYEKAETFEAVYEQMIEQVLELGRRSQGVVYAVPGHPFVAEATSPEIARRARLEGLPVQVVAGLSFLEPVFTALGLDAYPQTALIDALELAADHIPPFPPTTPALVAQLHSQTIASDVKLTLMAHYPDEHPVILVHAAGTTTEKIENLALYEIDRSPEIGLLTALYIPALGPDTSFEAFQEIIAHLRALDGCPWDRKQTHQTLRSYLLEETYEVIEALDADNPREMREEFGDLLLQIVLHAQIGAEYGEFTMADILKTVNNKIVRRHPHVFGELEIHDAEGVLVNWERLKAEERAENGKSAASALDGVALALPALSQAMEYLKRAARVGFDWPDVQGAIGKLEEELTEVYQAESLAERNLEIGDLLFTVANLARWFEVDPESALREANQRFRKRFAFLEMKARQQDRSLSDLSLEEMLDLWTLSKRVYLSDITASLGSE